MGLKGQRRRGVEGKDRMQRKDKVRRGLSAQLIDKSGPKGGIKARSVFVKVHVPPCVTVSVLMIYHVKLSKGLT